MCVYATITKFWSDNDVEYPTKPPVALHFLFVPFFVHSSSTSWVHPRRCGNSGREEEASRGIKIKAFKYLKRFKLHWSSSVTFTTTTTKLVHHHRGKKQVTRGWCWIIFTLFHEDKQCTHAWLFSGNYLLPLENRMKNVGWWHGEKKNSLVTALTLAASLSRQRFPFGA